MIIESIQMSMKYTISFLLTLSFLFNPQLKAADADLLYEDAVYENSIRTVEITPLLPIRGKPDILNINRTGTYQLEFDDLRLDADYYFVYMVHCNANWAPSEFKPIEYLFDYNEFEITNYEFSIDTRTPYVHYSMKLPRVRFSGNYLIVVYRGNNVEDIVLSKRVSVFEDRIGVGASVAISSGVVEREINQQIELRINYSNVDVMIPAEEIKVVIRQNQRWDNALRDLQPSFIRPDLKELEYMHFNLENNFRGGNEFRFFDIRTLNFRGENIGEIEILKDRIYASLYLDKDRGGQAYSEPLREDLNGQFQIANLDDSPAEVTGEYSQVKFSLRADKIQKPVYVMGAMNSWQRKPENLMTYNEDTGNYEGSQYLKQGWYDYHYLVEDTEPFLFEGSHRYTRNEYEILVYYCRKGSRGDLLLGYRVIKS